MIPRITLTSPLSHTDKDTLVLVAKELFCPVFYILMDAPVSRNTEACCCCCCCSSLLYFFRVTGKKARSCVLKSWEKKSKFSSHLKSPGGHFWYIFRTHKLHPAWRFLVNLLFLNWQVHRVAGTAFRSLYGRYSTLTRERMNSYPAVRPEYSSNAGTFFRLGIDTKQKGLRCHRALETNNWTLTSWIELTFHGHWELCHFELLKFLVIFLKIWTPSLTTRDMHESWSCFQWRGLCENSANALHSVTGLHVTWKDFLSVILWAVSTGRVNSANQP